MPELKIIAVIDIKESYRAELKDIFHEVVNETRKEAGVVSYDLHQDVKNANKFTIIEVWKSQQAIDEHNSSAHFQKFVQAIDGKINSLTIDVLKKIY